MSLLLNVYKHITTHVCARTSVCMCVCVSLNHDSQYAYVLLFYLTFIAIFWCWHFLVMRSWASHSISQGLRRSCTGCLLHNSGDTLRTKAYLPLGLCSVTYTTGKTVATLQPYSEDANRSGYKTKHLQKACGRENREWQGLWQTGDTCPTCRSSCHPSLLRGNAAGSVMLDLSDLFERKKKKSRF